MKIDAIIQARMKSTRLGGKILMDIGGQTMLARVVRRTMKARSLNEVIVATTDDPADDATIEECRRLGVGTFRGSKEDVLDRVYKAALAFKTETMVAITADNPLIDPQVIDLAVGKFARDRPDYLSNSTTTRTFPRGLDTEVVSFEALARAWREGKEFIHRVHVTPYIYHNPKIFRLESLEADADYSSYRWTVDTQADLDFVREVYKRFGNDDSFGWLQALALLEREPELTKINASVEQKRIEEG